MVVVCLVETLVETQRAAVAYYHEMVDLGGDDALC